MKKKWKKKKEKVIYIFRQIEPEILLEKNSVLHEKVMRYFLIVFMGVSFSI